ncbi:3-hydroxyacyl-CoA dehydrogenase NAD-binding domain-containing protein [Lysinibacter sp. HNR]|uniref:3-hydroxyacyl-CoA dehydrogenase NAD-binding domain-containing protein n=1 Tax=Lysinibacter sp. HNR TaxID=3031408 RepID=UPI0024354E6E|nr:3-hydroxyacyl-CoA dehydrogenase NAD-binding domain-containing protein [Lysinibacter sp. HNR]WGD37888.1 3-hydroxyacyl-CoA dehydrogenase NAD-binding domain-containing protein [Lysinibacter sp. HNR]
MIHWNRDSEGIITLVMDDPDNPVNTMNDAFIDSLDNTVTRLEAEIENVTGVILASAKQSWFAGGNLRELITASPETAREEYARVTRMKKQFRRLELLRCPVVAAINGTALGGGYEVALACHHRIAIDSPKTRIGLPEITLGMFPGAGGATRTVRMLGLERALKTVLLPGTRFGVVGARGAGLVDDVVETPEDLEAAAREWILTHPDAAQPWDRAGFRIPGGTPSTAGILPALAPFIQASPALLRQKLGGAHYPAPRALLASAVEGAQVDVDTALDIETRYFVSVIDTQVASNMIGAFFFDLTEVVSGASRPREAERHTVNRLGVIGAGMMGSAIAYTATRVGIDTVLFDTDVLAQERVLGYVRSRERERVLRQDPEASDDLIDSEVSRLLKRLNFSSTVTELAGTEFVIEAAYEDLEVKKALFMESENTVQPGTVLASNTSSLPIAEIADAVDDPSLVIGLHFFSPVDKMELVEIVRGPLTSDKTLARAFDLARQLRKTPIVVNDSRGFFTSRVIFRYIEEALAVLGEDINPVTLERAAGRAGYAVSPLKLIDELSLTLVDRIWRENARAQETLRVAGSVWSPATEARHTVDRMLRKGRLGRAAGAGFYDYSEGKRGDLWPGLSDYPGQQPGSFPHHPGRVLQPDNTILENLGERMLCAEALEAVRCCEEGVIASLADANIGSLLGIGFPPWTGGVLRYIEQYEGGVAGFVARCGEFARLHGPRFEPPVSLVRCAREGRSLAETYFKRAERESQ